jgi:TRAP-type C4-dicarboxylate transport system substrate-binding protein
MESGDGQGLAERNDGGPGLWLGAAGGAVAQEVTLRAVSAFQEGTAFSRPFEEFVKRVNEDGKGIVRINFIGGPRAMPPNEVGNAVRSGVVDIGNVTSAFYTNLLPERRLSSSRRVRWTSCAGMAAGSC